MFGLTGALEGTRGAPGLQFAGWCELGHNQKPPSAEIGVATLSHRLDLRSVGQTVLIPSVGYELYNWSRTNKCVQARIAPDICWIYYLSEFWG